ncbi:MAG: Asp-tRNA(Asn)/Glu-tRNA(Gln) amidotransferase subunit GatC [bacterium]
MLSKEEILKVATLARIGVSDEDVEKYQHDLSEILDYFKQLDEVDVAGVEPIGHITGMQNKFRNDDAVDFGKMGKDEIMKNAPEVKGEYIKVKSVL